MSISKSIAAPDTIDFMLDELKFRKGDHIRTTYQHSQAGRIVRYAPIPSYCNPGSIMEWYVVRFADGTGGTIHASMMNKANGQ